MDAIGKLIKLLPEYNELEQILRDFDEAKYILKKSLSSLAKYSESTCKNYDEDLEECSFLVQALVDNCWERIHTGQFSLVPLEIRQTYAIGCFCKILFMLIESVDKSQLELSSKAFDEAILIGCTENVFPNSAKFMADLTEYFDLMLPDTSQEFDLLIIAAETRREVKCDILQLNKPTVETFNNQCFKTNQPALLLNSIEHWAALDSWRNLNYLLKLAGNRTVPIEIGSNYATEDWSQQLIKIKDFLQRQFSNNRDNAADIEYLAQHELFEQIPQLKKDFSIPEYCSLGENKESVNIKAWLGPKGTISPMHYDPKHNLLCQVFGSKYIILAAPKDSEYLYKHDTEFLTNTSQIDAANVDYVKFPETSKVCFYTLVLQRGDCLYLPPGWWHYVRSESPSFSVSFWWE